MVRLNKTINQFILKSENLKFHFCVKPEYSTVFISNQYYTQNFLINIQMNKFLNHPLKYDIIYLWASNDNY